MQKVSTYLVIGAFILVALFGLPLTAHMSHDMGCPFSTGCVTAIEHVNHWQSAFGTVLDRIAILFAAVLVLLFRITHGLEVAQCTRRRYQRTVPDRPTFLQELFSSGILNGRDDFVPRERLLSSTLTKKLWTKTQTQSLLRFSH